MPLFLLFIIDEENKYKKILIKYDNNIIDKSEKFKINNSKKITNEYIYNYTSQNKKNVKLF